MENINYTEYDRITDTLMYLDENMSLNFSVTLSRKSKSGDRLFYHSEYMYGSDKYGGNLRSIKRTMSFCFMLDVRSDFNGGIMLRPQDVEILTRLITAKVLPWFFGNDQEVAFQIIANKLVLSDFQPATYLQTSRFDNKSLMFEPTVVTENDLECRGVRITLSSGHFAELPIDRFMGFYHLLANTDMSTLAATMCNYVKIGPYGVNSYKSQGLGATPPTSLNNWNNFSSNSFLNNTKSKREGE